MRGVSLAALDGTPQFTGFEIDQTMLRISAMNLMLHGADMPDVRYLDSISKNNTVRGKFDCILANPPFTGSVDAEDIDNSLKAIVNSKQTELLFVALFLRMLKPGGRCACIVPNGVLFRTNSKAYRQLRQELVDNQKLEAIGFNRFADKGDLWKITQKPFMEYDFYIPPLALQQEFAAFVRQVDKLKFETQQAIDKLQLLYDSLAQEYFGVN